MQWLVLSTMIHTVKDLALLVPAPTDDFMDLEYTSKEEGKRSIDSSHSRQRIMSFFGRVNYDYQSKYLLSLVLRRDGYSKLAEENRWGVFPGYQPVGYSVKKSL